MRVVAGDIGGTNVRLALVGLEPTPGGARAWRPEVLVRRDLRVEEHKDLATPLAAFVEGLPEPRPREACLGIAGTVIDQRHVEGVNLPWSLDAVELVRATPLERVLLINDFHAAARGVELLGPADLRPMGGGSPDPDGPIAILGAGTGLGQAFLLPEPVPPGESAGAGAAGSRRARRVVTTEGGHRDFASRSPLQDRLLAFLRGRHGRVSTERVLSGPGLEAIYVFLVEVEDRPPSAAVEEAPENHKAEAISRAAERQGHPTCQEALAVFVDVYGAEAGNLALTVLATGGVFLAGGIAPDVFGDPGLVRRFRTAFEDKGRFRSYLAGIPAWVVQNSDLGLLGAAAEAARA